MSDNKNGVTSSETEVKNSHSKPAAFFAQLIPQKGDKVTAIIRKIVFLASVPVLCASLAMLANVDALRQLFEPQEELPPPPEYIECGFPAEPEPEPKPEKTILDEYKSYYETNKNMVGWVTIDGTRIDYPVVKGEDNDYFLKHDFWGEESRSGCIMMDYRNVVSKKGNSGNLVLYGHNMAAGTFFADLGEYWRTLHDFYDGATLQMYKEHPTITFNTLYEKSTWKIFAVGIYNVKAKRGEMYPYNTKRDFTSREDFNNYIIDIMDRSDIFTDVDLKYGDELLTLSTCYWPYADPEGLNSVRLAVFARKVRDGESAEVNVEKATVNAYVKRWQWVYDIIGGGSDWSQSTWDRRKLISYTAKDAKKDGYTFLTD